MEFGKAVGPPRDPRGNSGMGVNELPAFPLDPRAILIAAYMTVRGFF